MFYDMGMISVSLFRTTYPFLYSFNSGALAQCGDRFKLERRGICSEAKKFYLLF